VKKLPGTARSYGIGDAPSKFDSLGYSCAKQAPNGVIHLITSLNKPALHFEMNEAWILDPSTDARGGEQLLANTATAISEVREHRQAYADGKPHITWSAGSGSDGRHLLHGPETWFYPDGRVQRQATYALGRKVGEATYSAPDGRKIWSWYYHDDGHADFVTCDATGAERTRTTWRNMILDK
jgi:hypothetical protein